MQSFLKSFLAIIVLASATSAQALVIEISETADFSGVVIVADDADNDGFVQVSSAIGTWLINVVSGFSSPAIGDQHVDKIHLNSVNVSGGQGTIYIRLTDTDFQRLEDIYTTDFGGTTDGSVSFQSYADGSNTGFGQGLLLSDSGTLFSGAFSGSDWGRISMEGAYSMSIYAAITHNDGFQISSFDYAVSVAEPGTLALVGLGLLGLGLSRRRKASTVAG